MNLPEPPPLLPTPAKTRRPIFLKLAGIGALIALLHIPLLMTNGVLRERQRTQQQATEEIAAVWGRCQRVTGPVLAVPYSYRGRVLHSRVVVDRVMQVEESELVPAVAYFLPENLAAAGTVSPEVRHRGIYDAVVYSARVKLSGRFRPDFAVGGIEAERVDWDKARILLGASDLHGIRTVSPLRLGDGKESSFETAEVDGGAFLPLAAKAPAAAGRDIEFSFDLALQGSERFEIVPVGKATTVTLQSDWPDPSFVGASLPLTRKVTTAGFDAEWQTSHFSRGFPQSWTSRLTKNDEMTGKLAAASFGARFAQPRAGYGMVERAQKYGVLFFVLIFAVFFLFEITAALKIHPLQYGLVGAALCLFFLGFLALSEFWPVGVAYAVAAGACTALIALYAWSFLKTGARTAVIAGGLGATYGYLYFVLRSEDYALIAGTVALFAVLALVMARTRRINWYEIEPSR